MNNLKLYLVGGALAVILGLGYAVLKQHDRIVRAEAVAELLGERVDSLKTAADSAATDYAERDSSYGARLDSLTQLVNEAGESADSLVTIELPPLVSNTDSLIAVLAEHVPTQLQPVVSELRVAVENERQTSAEIFREQRAQIAGLNASLTTMSERLYNAETGWEIEKRLNGALTAQLEATQLASGTDLLTDRVIPFVLGAGAILLVEKIF